MGVIVGGGTTSSPEQPVDDDREDIGEGGLLGFFDNALRDFGDAASGMWKLGAIAATDIKNRVGDMADLDIENDADDYLIDDIYGAITGTGDYKEEGSLLVNDYQARYGPASKGDIVGHINELYKHPLSFITDALTVATGGGWAAGKVASLAGKAGLTTKAAGAAVSAGDDLTRIGQIAKAIQGNARRFFNPETGKVETVAQVWNPARRLLYQDSWEKIISRPVGPYAKAAAQRTADLAESAGPSAAKFLLRQQKYQKEADAAIKAGAERFYVPWYAKSRGRKFVDRIVGQAYGKTSRITDELVDSWDRTLGDVDPKIASQEDLVFASQGTDTHLTDDGIVAPGSFDPVTAAGGGYRRAEVNPEWSKVPTINNGPTPHPQPGPGGVERMNEVIDTKVVEPEVDLERPGMSPEASARYSDELTTAMNTAPETVEQVGPFMWRIKNETDTLYLKMAEDGNQVISSLRVTNTGEVVADSMRGLPHTNKLSPGDELLEAHWKDAGIDTPEKAIAEFEKQTFTPSGAALAKRAAARLAKRTGLAGPGPRLPAEGTPFRAAFDAARDAGLAGAQQLIPKLKTALPKYKVTVGPQKGDNAIRSKAELLDGTWRDVEDAFERYRITGEDAWDDAKLTAIEQQILKSTGGKLRKREVAIGSPNPNGERGVRYVVEMPDGRVAEFQVLTPRAARVLDATANLRGIMGTMAVLAKRGELGFDRTIDWRYAERLNQHLWEGVTDELRFRRDPTAKPSEVRARMNDFRVDMWSKLTDPMLTKGLSIRSVMEDTFMPLRHKHGGRFDPEWNNGQGGFNPNGGPGILELDDALARGGHMAPMYYPLMDAAQLPKRGQFLQRGKAGSTALATDQNMRRNTGRLLSEARFSKDPRRVWEIRAAQSARMQQSMDLLFDAVAEYGHKLAPGEAVPDGYELFAPGLIKRLARQHNEVLDSLMDDPEGRSLRNLIDGVSGKNAQKLLDDIASGGDVETWAVPSYVARRLANHGGYKPLGSVEGFDMFFRTASNMWRTITLSGSPRWIVNNMFSNAQFLKLGGGSLGGVLRQANPRYLKKVRDALETTGMLDEIEGGGIYAASRATPRDYSEQGVANAVGRFGQKWITQTPVGNAAARGSDWMRRVNQAGEAAFRREMALTALERANSQANVNRVAKSFWTSKRRLEHAMSTGLDAAEARKAVDSVDKYFNDYNTMTPLERNVIRPYLMPFEAFYKHAAKLLLTMPFEHPAKFKLFGYIQEADKERMRHEGIDPELLPGWLRYDSLMTSKGEAGDYRFMSGGGLNPFNAVLTNPVNMSHPALKVMYEQHTGRSTFTGQEFTDPKVVKGGFGSSQSFRIGEDGQPRPVDNTRPGFLEHALQQLPQYDLLKDVIAGGKTYDTSTLIDVILHPEEEVIRDHETGEVWTPVTAAQALAKMFGWSERDYDIAAMEERTLAGKEAALEAYQKQQGLTGSARSGGAVVGGAP